MSLAENIRQYTEQLGHKGLLRTRSVAQAGLIHFDSNDYLSLMHDKSIAEFYSKGYATNSCGSGGSMLLSGYHSAHQEVERVFADWLGVESCLLFTSGYAANLSITGLLGRLKAHTFIDKGVHASIYDGLALAQARYTRFLHNNMDDLEKKLNAATESSALITEGIFSMNGQRSPLATIATLCKNNKIDCLVDEAHSFGILGKEGKGAVAVHGLTEREVPLRMVPFGKACAAQGALVAGQGLWIEALLQAGRPLIYSTALSPALCYGLLKTLDVVAAADDRRRKLMDLIEEFRACIVHSPLSWSDSVTPIQHLRLGCPHLALHYAQELNTEALVVRQFVHPQLLPGMLVCVLY